MIDLAIVKAVVDLFKEFVGLIDQGTKKRCETFDRTCKPLYEKLEGIAKEYYGVVQKASQKLYEPDRDLASILSDIRIGRAALIIARAGVLGEANAYIRTFGCGDDL